MCLFVWREREKRERERVWKSDMMPVSQCLLQFEITQRKGQEESHLSIHSHDPHNSLKQKQVAYGNMSMGMSVNMYIQLCVL